MREKIRLIALHPLITGSTIVFVGSFITNIFSYLLNLFMGRLLPVSEYGLLASLTSLLILLTIFSSAFMRIFAKFSASYSAQKDQQKLKFLILKGTKYIFIISLAVSLFLLLSTGFIQNLLKVDNPIFLFIIYTAIITSLFSSIPEGIIQGGMRFYATSIVSISQSVLKLLIAIGLVFLGFGLYGPLLAILTASFITTFLAYTVVLKNILEFKVKSVKIDSFRKSFANHTLTFVLASVGITLLSNTDIILVRYFFPEDVSGQYAALSLMGRAIFYLVVPINFVFFPLIAQKKEKNERLFNTFIFTSGLVFVISLAISFVYFAFPSLILNIFFPRPEYRILESYLGLFSLYILLFSLVNVMNSFFLSIGKTKSYIFTLLGAVAQIFLIILFHESLYQVIGVLFFVNFLLLLAYFIYYMKHGKD